MQVVREQELDVPPDHRVIAVLNKDSVELLLLPAMVDDGELTIAELEQVAGGGVLPQSFWDWKLTSP